MVDRLLVETADPTLTAFYEPRPRMAAYEQTIVPESGEIRLIPVDHEGVRTEAPLMVDVHIRGAMHDDK